MPQPFTDTFIAALRTLEETRDAQPLVALYAPNGVAGNVLAPDAFHGPDGARRFWTEYRGAFQSVRSEFRSVISADNRAALEWTTTGTAFDGAPIRYEGVTILETNGAQITRSCAYFNPAGLGRQMEK